LDARQPPAGPPPDLLDAEVLRAALPARAANGPVSVELAWSLDSTNSELWRRPAAEGCQVLFAECQTAGRGRLGRHWVSPLSTQVCLSVRRRFDGGLGRLDGLSLVAGVAVVEALRGLGVARAGLKWPNDVLADGCKLAGLLVECRGDRTGPAEVVAGVGVNVRLPPMAGVAIDQPWTDLARLCAGGVPPTRNAVAIAVSLRLLDALDRFDRDGLAVFLPRHADVDILAGREVRVLAGRQVIEGRALGLAADGGLRVLTEAGERVFHAGEVSVRMR